MSSSIWITWKKNVNISGREEICGDVIVLPAAPATESPIEAPTEPPMCKNYYYFII